MKTWYSIGEFSQVTGLSVKTLRFYHEKGILIPSSVDEATAMDGVTVRTLPGGRGLTLMHRAIRSIGSQLREDFAAGERAEAQSLPPDARSLRQRPGNDLQRQP